MFRRFKRRAGSANIDELLEGIVINEVVHKNVLDRKLVQVDQSAKKGLTGLPPEYQTVLETTDLTKTEVAENKDEVLNYLQIHFEGVPKMPTRASVDRQLFDNFEVTPGDPEKIYEKTERLGEGGAGVVYKCRNMKTNEEFAVKLVSPQKFEDIRVETSMQALSEHENVVKVVEVYQKINEYWIIIELMNGGSLVTLINRKLTEEHLAYVFREALQGLESLHSNYRLHRDIKPDNILWDYAGRVKLADFGFAVTLTAEMETRNTQLGTPGWMAPEIIKSRTYNEKVDLWALGISCIEVADGTSPAVPGEGTFSGQIRGLKRPSPTLDKKAGWSKEFHDFVGLCLQKDPEKRPPSSLLLMHPFLASASTRSSFIKFLKTPLGPPPKPHKQKKKKKFPGI